MNNSTVQSIGRIRNFVVRAPWGSIALAGGPYRNLPDEDNYFGVKVAREIKHPYSVKIDIEDFKIPKNDGEVELAILSALVAARIGMVLGVMIKALTRASRRRVLGVAVGRTPDPVEYVREHYNAHACETGAQQAYVRGFNTGYLEEVLRTL
jgi:hypothetical protein